MGQRVIPVAVTAEYIGGDGVTLGAAGSHNSVLIEYDFRSAGPQWDDISGRYVLWTNPQGNSTNRINLGVSEKVEGYEGVYQAAPPADAMCVPGWAEMVVVGFTLDGDKEVTKIKTEPSRFRVLPGSSRSADNEWIAPTVADQLQAEIEAVNDSLESRKVNKPTTPYSENGMKGQILETLGDGSTRWRDETVATKEVVDEVLREHPDWVTTVEDGAISEAKLADAAVSEDKLGKKVKEKMELLGVKSHSIIPVYVGDYMSSAGYIPACCVRIGDYMYCIDTRPSSSAVQYQDDYGTVRKFDLTQNKEVTGFRKSILVGHGNSITYDSANDLVYIAPTATFASGQIVSKSCLYVYDNDFNFIEEMATPEAVTGVAFDSKTEKIYAYNNASKRVYVRESDAWTLFTTIDFSNVSKNNDESTTYNQDFAVYEGKFFCSSWDRNIIYGNLYASTSKVVGAFNLAKVDTEDRFRLGELEGMDFSPDGRLYAVTFIQLYTAYSAAVNCVVVELDVGTSVVGTQNYGTGTYIHPHYNVTLSDETQAKFSLGESEIRSLVQVNLFNQSDTISRVVIPDGANVNDPYDVLITRNLTLEINGHYTATRFLVLGGTLTVFSTTETHVLEFNAEASVFQVRYNGNLKLVGSQSLRIKADNLVNGARNLVNVYNSFPFITLRVIPTSLNNLSFYIGDTQVEKEGVYVGQSLLWEAL